jgi:hypothetical protein
VSTTLPKCLNCRQPVAQFEKDGDWHHYHSLWINCSRVYNGQHVPGRLVATPPRGVSK